MERYSEITFEEFSKDLAYTKVVWNGTMIWDDNLIPDDYPPEIARRLTGIDGLHYIKKVFGPKKIYSAYVRIVNFHHCELYVEGE